MNRAGEAFFLLLASALGLHLLLMVVARLRGRAGPLEARGIDRPRLEVEVGRASAFLRPFRIASLREAARLAWSARRVLSVSLGLALLSAIATQLYQRAWLLRHEPELYRASLDEGGPVTRATRSLASTVWSHATGAIPLALHPLDPLGEVFLGSMVGPLALGLGLAAVAWGPGHRWDPLRGVPDPAERQLRILVRTVAVASLVVGAFLALYLREGFGDLEGAAPALVVLLELVAISLSVTISASSIALLGTILLAAVRGTRPGRVEVLVAGARCIRPLAAVRALALVPGLASFLFMTVASSLEPILPGLSTRPWVVDALSASITAGGALAVLTAPLLLVVLCTGAPFRVAIRQLAGLVRTRGFELLGLLVLGVVLMTPTGLVADSLVERLVATVGASPFSPGAVIVGWTRPVLQFAVAAVVVTGWLRWFDRALHRAAADHVDA